MFTMLALLEIPAALERGREREKWLAKSLDTVGSHDIFL